MIKYIDTTNNYLLKLIKKKRLKNVYMYTVPVSLANLARISLLQSIKQFQWWGFVLGAEGQTQVLYPE